MGYKDFEQQVIQKVLGLFGDGYSAEIEERIFENGVKKRGLIIKGEGMGFVFPITYLERYYLLYGMGKSVDEVARELYRDLLQNMGLDTKKVVQFTSLITEWSSVKELIFPILLSDRRNTEMKERFVYRIWLDFDIFYMIRGEMTEEGYSYTRVTKQLMEQWGVTEGEIYLQALSNMNRDGYSLIRMEQLLGGILAEAEQPLLAQELFGGPEMYVLTNRNKVYGAAGILMGADYFREAFDGKNFYVLPSSVHETILVMDEDKGHMDTFNAMVNEVNEQVVVDRDFLSDHAYYYDMENGVLEVA